MNFIYYLIQNKVPLFLLFTFPILSQIISSSLTKTQKLLLLYLSILVLFLRIFGLKFSFLDISSFFILLFFVSIFSLLKKDFNWRVTILFSIILFSLSSFLYFIISFIGKVKADKEWVKDNYKVELIIERGFSGGPLYSYTLNKYYVSHFLIKKCEILYDIKKTNECKIIFPSSKIEFDKCTNSIEEIK